LFLLNNYYILKYICLFCVLVFIIYILVIPIPAISQVREKNLETHVHVNLKMYMNDHEIIVPANIGIDPRLWKNHSLDRYSGNAQHLSALHTHASDGTIHAESIIFNIFTLGDFLNVWGLNQSMIKNVHINNKEIKSPDYRTLPLQNNQNLTMELKSENSTTKLYDFVNHTYGLAFSYPSYWVLHDLSFQKYPSPFNEKFNYTLQLHPKNGDFLGAPFLIPHIEIKVIKLLSNNKTLDQFLVTNLPMILELNLENSKDIEILKSIESYPFTLDGNPARKIVMVDDNFTGGNANNVTQKTMQIWCIKNDNLYIISYNGITSPVTTTSFRYDNYTRTINEILDSFKIY
jgi:hypothetical protein